MWAQEQGLGAHASPWAGTLGISLRVDSRSWPQSPLGFGKPPVILAILASAFGIQNITIFKYPIEHVHIFFFCLTVSQIQQALRRLKRSIISVLWTSSSPCWHHHLPWNAYSSCGWCISPVSTFRLLCLWHLTNFPLLLCQGCCFPSCFMPRLDDVAGATVMRFIHLNLFFT